MLKTYVVVHFEFQYIIAVIGPMTKNEAILYTTKNSGRFAIRALDKV